MTSATCRLRSGKRLNFDDPEELEHTLLIAHLRELKQGHPISRPVYDFATYTRVPGVEEPRR